MGKKVIQRLPTVCVPDRLRSNQDDERDSSNHGDDSCNVSSSTAKRKTTRCSTSDLAATSSTEADLNRSKSVVVLRRCDDLNVRTGGFQKIEEAAYRPDIRRPRQQQQQQSPKDLQQLGAPLNCQKRLLSGSLT